MSVIDDPPPERNVADRRFSAFEGKVKEVGSGKPVRFGRDPGKCSVNALMFLGSTSVPIAPSHCSDAIAQWTKLRRH